MLNLFQIFKVFLVWTIASSVIFLAALIGGGFLFGAIAKIIGPCCPSLFAVITGLLLVGLIALVVILLKDTFFATIQRQYKDFKIQFLHPQESWSTFILFVTLYAVMEGLLVIPQLILEYMAGGSTTTFFGPAAKISNNSFLLFLCVLLEFISGTFALYFFLRIKKSNLRIR